MQQGNLFVISGPSGVGKGTLISRVLDLHPQIHLAKSATTRAKRAHESNEYYFLSDSEFQSKIKHNDFLEWCSVHTHHYGTLKSEVVPHIERGNHVILEIDVQGAEKIRSTFPSLISIFVTAPSMDTLSARLKERNTENESVIESRLKTASQELAAIGKYDYIVVNDRIDTAVSEISDIIQSSGPLSATD